MSAWMWVLLGLVVLALLCGWSLITIEIEFCNTDNET